MTTIIEPILHIPESVHKDIIGYRAKLKSFINGETSPISFKAYRVPMGIYEQRTNGRYMVRARLGAGIVLSKQLERLAALSNAYGSHILHFTTRQDVQIHDVAIESTANILEQLLEVGLTSRGGGGNTVRNVSACPRSGVCPKERFDVAPYAIAVAEYLLQHGSSFNLPRKYKVAFSGCGDDCALASVADLGFFAQIRNDVHGFSVFAGGGLGMNARGGILIEEFILPEQVLEVAEAIRRLFDKRGDRVNKHKARLRYVLNNIGEDSFKALYQTEVKELRERGLEGLIPAIRNLEISKAAKAEQEWKIVDNDSSNDGEDVHLLLDERDPNSATIRLPLLLGDVPADDATIIARVAELYGRGVVRTTQEQELIIPGMHRASWNDARTLLLTSHIYGEIRRPRPRIVACAGASTCKLGLCQSRNLAKALIEQFDNLAISELSDIPTIRISGCPNSCGGHNIAEIGLEGRAERHNGRLLPMYVVSAGGKVSEHGARLAEPLGAAPARRIPELLVKAFTRNPKSIEGLHNLVSAYGLLAKDAPEEYFQDIDENAPFSLAGRGPGECGVGVFDVVRVDIREAIGAITAAKGAQAQERAELIYRATLAASRSLLVIFGLELRKDREIFTAFERELIVPGWISSGVRDLIAASLDWKIDKEAEPLLAQFDRASELVARVQELFTSLDANLKFRVSRVADKQLSDPPVSSSSNATRLDLSGVPCPMNFVRAKIVLESIPVDSVLEVLLDGGEPIRNVPASFAEQEQEVLAIEPFENLHLLRIRRKK
jgi:sulfite reductase (ferredoxin)